LVVNGSEALVVTRRDKDATWRKLGTLGWSQPDALYELQNGWPYRTIPPGHVINWRDPNVRNSLNVQASTVQLLLGVIGDGMWSGFDIVTVTIEVMPPARAEVGPSLDPPDAPVPAPTLRKPVSDADLRKAVQAIVSEHPQDRPPLDEDELRTEVERRLDKPVARDRVRDMRDAVAPNFKLPPGRPRKSAQ
jgi:hypothetical protein